MSTLDFDLEPTELAFDGNPSVGTASELNGFCQGCRGAGWITWTDHTEGPCVICQGDDDLASN